jgi:hypothetical protein
MPSSRCRYKCTIRLIHAISIISSLEVYSRPFQEVDTSVLEESNVVANTSLGDGPPSVTRVTYMILPSEGTL